MAKKTTVKRRKRTPDGKFAPGVSGNPSGRPAGSKNGRARALALLDDLMGDERNQRKLLRAFQDRFDDDPARFFLQFIAPLLPKESLVKMETHNKLPVRVLFENEKGKDKT
jgi:hypothetical protein